MWHSISIDIISCIPRWIVLRSNTIFVTKLRQNKKFWATVCYPQCKYTHTRPPSLAIRRTNCVLPCHNQSSALVCRPQHLPCARHFYLQANIPIAKKIQCWHIRDAWSICPIFFFCRLSSLKESDNNLQRTLPCIMQCQSLTNKGVGNTQQLCFICVLLAPIKRLVFMRLVGESDPISHTWGKNGNSCETIDLKTPKICQKVDWSVVNRCQKGKAFVFADFRWWSFSKGLHSCLIRNMCHSNAYLMHLKRTPD